MKIFFNRLLLTAVLVLTSVLSSLAADSTTVVFDFSSLHSLDGAYTISLQNGATLSSYGNHPCVDLGTENGYVDLGSDFGKFISSLGNAYSVSATIFIPKETSTAANGNFVWCFSKSSSEGYLMLSAKDARFAITKTDYTGEQNVTNANGIAHGKWVTVTFKQVGKSGRLFVDGTLKSGSVSLFPDSLSSLPNCYLGKSCYDGDAYLKGARIARLLVTDFTPNNTYVNSLNNLAKSLNNYEDSMATVRAMEEFSMPDLSALSADITLPTTFRDSIAVSWATSDPSVITADGHVTRPAVGSPKATATLTATLTTSACRAVKEFAVGVLPEFTEAEAVQYAVDNLSLTGHLNNLYDNLVLPTVGKEHTVIVWSSSKPEVLDANGRVVSRPAAGTGHDHVVLTATVLKGQTKMTKTFDVYVHDNEPYTNYLFVYFPSNSNENLYYAISSDGYNYTPINNGQSFLKADTTTIMGGLRDPHILRGEDGMFYMVVTDMRSALGWASNRGIVLMKSADLIHWTHHTVHFPTRFAGTSFADVTRVWAPETIWDPNYVNADGTKGRYMIYFSILGGPAAYDKDYYFYANDDFSDVLGDPQYLYDRGSATIDMDIVYNETDSLYHGFFKNEGEGGICKVTARSLTPAEGEEPGSQWSKPSAPLQQTTENVEGAGVFKLINADKWILMYDCYSNGHYQFCSSPDLSSFTFVQNTQTRGAFTPRHGTVIPITAAETEALMKALPNDAATPQLQGAADVNVRSNYVVISADTAFVPVQPGTDISSYDPQLFGNAGDIVSPVGPQDFSKGPVTYTLTNGSNTQTYQVRVEADANPVIPAFHADPEVLFSKQTGRFYIYPTTDGYAGWGGYKFNVFSSPDLVHFTDEGTMLDLTTDVAWATGNAWAPAIEEKWVDGAWKYYFYFSGQNPTYGRKTIGVAVADNPVGPFVAKPQPLFTSTSGGQMIDVDVFTDPVSGKSYLYYGNGQMHWRLLSDDMLSVGDEHTITPAGGSLSDYAFREATYVFYRNGVYYFLWSVDDTGSANYHVAYGTSTSPEGPITVAKQPIVLIQNPDLAIYGPAHCSVVNVPGTDNWYIVYHRINRNYLNNSPGVHREVCVDKLSFNADGTIAQVQPTRVGVSPVSIGSIEDYVTAIRDVNAADASAQPVATRFYNLQGQFVGTASPFASGIYVRQQTFSDGTVRSSKVLKR